MLCAAFMMSAQVPDHWPAVVTMYGTVRAAAYGFLRLGVISTTALVHDCPVCGFVQSVRSLGVS